jgi:hypothetical protein
VWAEGALGGQAHVRFRRLRAEGALGQEEEGRLASRVEQLQNLLTVDSDSTEPQRAHRAQ